MLALLQNRALRLWLDLGAALFLLNFLLTFHNLWPTLWIRYPNELSIELTILVLVLALYAEFFRSPTGARRTWLALLLLVLTLGRYADVTAPALYGRPVNLYWDAQHLPNVAAMVMEALPFGLIVLLVLAILGLLAGLYALLRWCLGRVWLGLEQAPTRRTLGVAAAVLLAVFVIGKNNRQLTTEHWFALPVTPTYARQVGFLFDAFGDGDRTLPNAPVVSADLSRLRPADVFVIFIESYGATAFDNPQFLEHLTQYYDDLVAVVAESQRFAVSAFITAPTFGGSSWLSHSSFLTGIELRDEGDYQRLLTSQRVTWAKHFRTQGYRAVALMPGLRRAWPEGGFYGFDHIYNAASLDYRGPAFGWWRIPDQYSVARFHRIEIEAQNRRPLLAFFPTISSHSPFRPTPDYQPDWERVLSPDPFPPKTVAIDLAAAGAWLPDGTAYVETLAYELTWLAGYLEGWGKPDTVFVVLGDHQPQASVTGKDASWDVPVHVIGRQTDILDTLVAAGFSPGFLPPRAPIAKTHELSLLLLNAFSASSGPESLQAVR